MATRQGGPPEQASSPRPSSQWNLPEQALIADPTVSLPVPTSPTKKRASFEKDESKVIEQLASQLFHLQSELVNHARQACEEASLLRSQVAQTHAQAVAGTDSISTEVPLAAIGPSKISKQPSCHRPIIGTVSEIAPDRTSGIRFAENPLIPPPLVFDEARKMSLQVDQSQLTDVFQQLKGLVDNLSSSATLMPRTSLEGSANLEGSGHIAPFARPRIKAKETLGQARTKNLNRAFTAASCYTQVSSATYKSSSTAASIVTKSSTSSTNTRSTARSIRPIHRSEASPAPNDADTSHDGSVGIRHTTSSKHHANNIFQRIAFNHYFEHVCAAIILGHAFILGLYVHYAIAIGYPVHSSLKYANIAFTAVFLGEVLLKMVAEGKEYIFGCERYWNAFDVVLAFSVILDWGVALSGASSSAPKEIHSPRSLLKITELVRTLRILRIFKVLRLSFSLSQVITVVFSSLKTVAWMSVLICVTFYVAAVIFTQAASDYLNQAQFQSEPLNDIETSIYLKFGSVIKSLFSTFKAVTGGEQWGTLQEILAHCGRFYGSMFTTFVTLCFFVLFNIFVGIFVDAAMQTSTKERGLIANRHQKMEFELAENLREVFLDLDADMSGALSLDEFLLIMTDEEVVHYMNALKLDISEPKKLFKLLDTEATGEVLIENLVLNCMKLKGEARSIDIHQMIYENRRMIRCLNDFMKSQDFVPTFGMSFLAE